MLPLRLMLGCFILFMAYATCSAQGNGRFSNPGGDTLNAPAVSVSEDTSDRNSPGHQGLALRQEASIEAEWNRLEVTGPLPESPGWASAIQDPMGNRMVISPTKHSLAQVIWADDFESYQPGTFPGSPWGYTGNSNIRATSSIACEGSQSLGAHGSIGGCWEAIVCHPIEVSTLEGFVLEFCIFISSDHRAGCHPWQGGCGMRTHCSWTTGQAVGLFGFPDTGEIVGRSGRLGHYEQDTWYRLRVRYLPLDSSTIQLDYWINDEFVETQITQRKSYEDNLIYFNFSTGDGSTYYDDITVSTLFEHDVAPIEIVEPDSIVNLGTAVFPRAAIRNYGLSADTFSVTFGIGSVYSDQIEMSLQPGQLDTVTFAQWNADSAGTFIASCRTDLAGDEYPANDLKTETVVVHWVGPEIHSIWPNRGGNTGSVTVGITGAKFKSGATVKLTKAGQPDIVADTLMTTVVDSSSIRVTFDLAGAEVGAWNVVLANPDGYVTTFHDGFSVEVGEERLWLDLVGRNEIRIGRWETYWISFGNAGNVDIYDAFLAVKLPAGIDVHVILQQAEVGIGTLFWPDFPEDAAAGDGTSIVPIWLYSVPVMSSDAIAIRMRPTAQYEQGEMHLEAEIGYPPRSPFWLGGNLSNVDTTLVFLSGLETVIEMEEDILERSGYSLDVLDGIDRRRVRQEAEDIIQRETSKWKTPRGLWDWLKVFWSSLWHSAFSTTVPAGGFVDEKLGAAGAGLALYFMKLREFDDIWWTAQGLEPPSESKSKNVTVTRSYDPNDKTGPTGYDDLGYVPADESFYYFIHFENVDTATAAAQEIKIVDTLDVDLDWESLAFRILEVGNITTSISGTVRHFNTTVPLNDTTEVIVDGSLDLGTGVVSWHFTGIDTRTGGLADFLPPNEDPPEGQGNVGFTIRPKAGLPSGTVIENIAAIKFDVNDWILAPMDSVPIFNTIDASPPTSSVMPLAAEQPLSSFEVSWVAADDDSGSGLRDCAIYVSDNGGPYTEWLTTESTKAMFRGENGHTYKFYSIACDNVGHLESALPAVDTAPDAATTINLPTGIAVSPNPYVPSRGHNVISFFGATLPSAKIKVYNKAGELVRALEELDGKDRLDWDAKSDDGEALASGIYIWIAKTRSGSEEKGKLAIIR